MSPAKSGWATTLDWHPGGETLTLGDMFTGIVERMLKVSAVAENPMFRRLTFTAPQAWSDCKHGDSIAFNGVCLTVAEITQRDGAMLLGFDVIKETLEKTNLGLLTSGDAVNVERSLRAGDRMDGHFVQGHVDGTATMIEQVSNDQEWRLVIQAPDALAKYIVPKGSVSIDGVSLTVAEVRGTVFEVALIPTTLQLTTLGSRPTGWPFNLETDILSKTIVRYLELRGI